jgi:hypothetical protein
MPDEDPERLAIIAAADTVRTIGHQVIAAGTTFNETRGRLDNVSAHLDNMSTNFASMSALVKQFQETVRVDLMLRLDRIQDEQTKQRIEMEAAVQLLRDSSPAELLVRIRQLQDEIRELKEEKDRQPPP